MAGRCCSADDVAITREEEAGNAMDVDFHVMANGSDVVVPGDVVDVVLEESGDDISSAIGKTVGQILRDSHMRKPQYVCQ